MTVPNDFELVCRVAKELTQRLHALGAHSTTNSLHELITAAALSDTLTRELRFLATLRNKLVHEQEFNRLGDDDRAAFCRAFTHAQQLLAARQQASANINTSNGRRPPLQVSTPTRRRAARRAATRRRRW